MSATAAAAVSIPPVRSPKWVSYRRLLEQKLVDLHRCSDLRHLEQVHAQVYRHHLHAELFVAPRIISAYSNCLPLHPGHRRLLLDALRAAFRQVPLPNAHLYNTLVRALAANALPSHAFAAFFDMQRDGVQPDNFTYPFLLKACCGALDRVQMLHCHVVKLGFFSDVFVPNAFIDAYSRCGDAGVPAAWKVFDHMAGQDVVSWNSIVAATARAGKLEEARRLFDEMPERDTVSWNTMLDGYAKAGEMDRVFELFNSMPERNVVSWSTVVSGFCKAGDMDMARALFDRMPVRNLVAWTIMISGYAEKGMNKEALALFAQMEGARLQLDIAAVVSILAACAESGMLSLGKRIHSYLKGSQAKFTTRVCNALVDMYAKCGCLNRAWTVFEGMDDRDLVSWNSMVQGLAMHGHGERALELFTRMKKEDVVPDGITFVGVLCACAHVGLVEEARDYFASMGRDYGILPEIEHYGCMVDILGRGGLLTEAFELIKSMPFEPNAIIWGTLLGACRVHNNVGLAEQVVDQLIRLEPSDSGSLAILSNIYAAAGCWEGVAKARTQMRSIGQQKPAGSSWIELEDMFHEFTVGDRTHPQAKRIVEMLDRLGKHLKQVMTSKLDDQDLTVLENAES